MMPKCSSPLNGSFGQLLISEAWSRRSGSLGEDLLGKSDLWEYGRGGAVMDWATNSDLVTFRSGSEDISHF